MTCATSCTLAPTHAPNRCGSVSPTTSRSSGNTAIARLPHKVTSAIAYVTSSSSASTTPSTAATAEAPHIENPVAISRESDFETPKRGPSHMVPRNVVATTSKTTITSRPPNSTICSAANCVPSSTMPNRNILFAAKCCPGVKLLGTRPVFPISTPNNSEATSGLTLSNCQWIVNPAYVTANTNNKPGA